MPKLTDRLQKELDFHNRQAQDRARDLQCTPDRYAFSDDDYLDHESWIRQAFSILGNVSGKTVLDLGCGHGMAAIVLSRNGAYVTAIDLSLGYLQEAQERADANEVSIDLVQADGERLPFADGAFDLIWGNAVLHHLDLFHAAAEIERVLRPDGVAVFCEPWGGNPLLNWARRSLPYTGKARTPDERPLHGSDIHCLERFFSRVDVTGIQFLSMFRRVMPFKPLTIALNRCDDLLLSHFPALQRFCRYVVITLRR